MNNINRLNNTILNTDSYKLSHYLQYPEKMTSSFGYGVARKAFDDQDEVTFYSLQYIIDNYLSTPITMDDINYAEKFVLAQNMPFNRSGWEYIVKEHNGKLPIIIKALPEGETVKIKNVLFTVESTDPECRWLTTYVETMLMRAYYGTTVASFSRYVKKIINDSLNKTADDPESEILIKLHDFGARGVSSQESAGIGGSAHLINFIGTDTIAGMVFAHEAYSAELEGLGVSIPASEHSTMTVYGKEQEYEAYQNMVDKFARRGSIFACVSDSYDIFNAVRNIWCRTDLLDKVENIGATVVIRPDSGDPVDTPIKVIEILMEERGYKVNSKGYKVLPDYVRVIQGDGMEPSSIKRFLEKMEKKKISTSNIVFGMGGGLLQKLDRDSFGFAIKLSSANIDGKDIDVYKDPITDKGKTSLKGRLKLIKFNGEYRTVREDEFLEYQNQLRVVFENGTCYNKQSFQDIRERAKL